MFTVNIKYNILAPPYYDHLVMASGFVNTERIAACSAVAVQRSREGICVAW
jgi:hypothetical protein